jgi:GntR family transcriptional regulator
MKFQISKSSPIPISTQLKERIMIAMSLGELRPGDVLPSIRDLEASLGVGRAIIRRVYLELGQQGLLEIQHGRRVSVRDVIPSVTDVRGLSLKLDVIVKDALGKARKLNVNEISFGRYLLSKALEENRTTHRLLFVDWNPVLASERAQEVSEIWGLPVTPIVLSDLSEFLATHGKSVNYILTTYYRFEKVSQEVQLAKLQGSVEVLPINVHFKPVMVRKISSLAPGSKVWLFSEPKEFHRKGQSFVEVYQEVFRENKIQFYVKEAATEADVLRTVKSSHCALLILNTLLWSKVSEETRNLPRISRSLYQLDRDTLEAARVRAGIFPLPI